MGLYYRIEYFPTSIYLLVLSCLNITQEPIKIPKLSIKILSNYFALQLAYTWIF